MDASLVLEDFIKILHIIYSLKSGSLWFSFERCKMKRFSEVQKLSIGPFKEVQRKVIYFPFAIRKNVSYPKILAHTVKVVKILVPIISEHP